MMSTAAGYYTGSPGADRLGKWLVGDDVVSVEAYQNTFFRPDLVRKSIRGEALLPSPEAERFAAGQAIPPQLQFVTPLAGQEIAGDEVSV